jgi:hypothetical protein
LLGPEHRQISQALDAEPAWKATLHRCFRQDGGDEGERYRHPNRSLALVFAHGERLDGLGKLRLFPPMAVMIPIMIMWSFLNFNDTWWGLALIYGIVTLPFASG